MESPSSVNALSALRGVRYFFFDLDGTLADSASGLQGSIKKAFAAVDREMPQVDLRRYIGPGIRTILTNLDNTLTDSMLDLMERAFRADYDGLGVLRTHMFAGVKEVLERLHTDACKLFIVTNKPMLATGKLLAKYDLTNYFLEVVSRNSREPVFASKGEMLRDVAMRNAAPPEQSLMIGDTQEDASAALEAGMRFAHAAYGYGTIREADITLASITELLRYCTVGSMQRNMDD